MILDEGCCKPIPPDAPGANGFRMLFVPAKLVTRAGLSGAAEETWTSLHTFNLNDFSFGSANFNCTKYLCHHGDEENVKVHCHDGTVLRFGDLDG
jgi:hypothetical protein